MSATEVIRTELKKFNIDVVLVNPGDAPNTTPLTSGQGRHYQVMEQNFTEEERLIHGELFEKCKDYYSKTFPVPDLQMIDNPGYYTMMEKILRLNNPGTYYANSDWITTIFFTVIFYLPRRISDVMRLGIMKCYKQ